MYLCVAAVLCSRQVFYLRVSYTEKNYIKIKVQNERMNASNKIPMYFSSVYSSPEFLKNVFFEKIHVQNGRIVEQYKFVKQNVASQKYYQITAQITVHNTL